MDIWEDCREAVVLRQLTGELIRMVESQAQIATRELVDDLAEQALLEEMLETSKPPIRPGTEQLDYLLASPFRYPPLGYGSRFGSRFEPSIFYGALDLSPVLAETAYYRLAFWSGMVTPPPDGRLSTAHTLFSAGYATERGLRLDETPFDDYRATLTDPQHYSDTQRLGSRMREAGIEMFIYRSARDPDGGLNVALFEPGAFAGTGPLWKASWLCDTREEEVSFYNKTEGTRVYYRSQFLVDGRLPFPPD
ncbi:MAG: RES family NAD+ phosphorylase [Candidatus Thiodiazotropha sp. (ex Monitilora ramsayi)]|nr:RES family NAD+ phosphorylase [Candidatus Thiodiazotropha sp. (ex Monitilora ramsayi)]